MVEVIINCPLSGLAEDVGQLKPNYPPWFTKGLADNCLIWEYSPFSKHSRITIKY